MLNPFTYSDSNKRYFTYDYYLKTKYNSKVSKIALDGGFYCPNRDGKISFGGCIFCSALGSGDFAGDHNENVLVQYEKGKKIILKKWDVNKFIAYFQAYSNTYGSIEHLKSCYDPFVNVNDCVEIALGTRPDCFNEEIYDYLEDLNTKKPVTVELGLQTSNDETGKILNRGITFSTFKEALYELKKRGLRVVVHIINGLPNETKEIMLQTVKDLSELPIDGIKIHSLCILKNTALEHMYKNYHILTKEEYVDIVCDQIELLPPHVVIERITGDAKKEDLITPLWSLKKTCVVNDIDKELKRRNSYQGKNYHVSKAVKLSHDIISNLSKKIVAIDATLGNGHDSLFLANEVKKVFSFDIQSLAIKRSKKRLINAKNVQIINDSFVNITKYYRGNIDLALFNLGFLPGSNKKIITKKEDTLGAILSILPKAKNIIVVFYTKHDNNEEYEFVTKQLKDFNIDFDLYNDLNDEKLIHIH